MLSRVFGFGRRPFDSLSEQEILALAISSEEDDGRIYRAYADGLREQFPQSAKVFDDMADEEDRHRAALIELHGALRRAHSADPARACAGLLRAQARLAGAGRSASTRCARQAEAMEAQAHRFYIEAAKRTTDASTRKLLGDLAAAEKGIETLGPPTRSSSMCREDVQRRGGARPSGGSSS